MKKEQFAFLFAGLAFGFLLGFGLFRAVQTRPSAAATEASSGVPSVAGPAAPTTTMGGAPPAAGDGAPMMAEIAALKERVAKDPKDADGWTRLGNLYQDASMFEPAIEFYRRASELRPTDGAVLTDSGICYQQLKQFDNALGMFERAQKVDPANWQSLYNIVVVAGLGLGRFDKADAAIARLEQVKPDTPNLADLRRALDAARAGAAPATR